MNTVISNNIFRLVTFWLLFLTITGLSGMITLSMAAEVFEDQFETPVQPIAIEAGIWSISGTDNKHGGYTGQIEIREISPGEFAVIRLISFNTFKYHDGRTIDLVWTGIVLNPATTSAQFFFTPFRADFITNVGDVEHTSDDTPLEVTGNVMLDSNRLLKVEYFADGFSANESGAFLRAPGASSIWKSQRSEVDAQSDPGSITKGFWFNFYDSYHDLPEVQIYNNNDEFERAIQLQIDDQTDFDFYSDSDNYDRLRVINKIIDDISLAETEIRANAFRATYAEKAEFYQTELNNNFIGSEGMVLAALDDNDKPFADASSALWTGIYLYTQALRYEITGDNEALENLERSLPAIFKLMDITNDPRTFARGLSAVADNAERFGGGWQQGTGEFAGFFWHNRGNNDMSKGLLLGMIAGWQALPVNHSLRNMIPDYALALLELCVFIENPPNECGSDDSDILNLPSTNPGTAKLLAGITNNMPTLINQGLASLNESDLISYAERDDIDVLGIVEINSGPFYEYGVGSDWSGNHLNLTTTLALQWLLAQTSDTNLAQLWTEASRKDWLALRRLDPPLQAAHAIAVGAINNIEIDAYAEASGHVIWGLRSFHLPKNPHPVNHSIHPGFVLATYPSLPWKFDWEDNPERRQSIRNYPLLEHAPDSYWWNDAQFLIESNGFGGLHVPGVDYLFLYWLARSAGLISATD